MQNIDWFVEKVFGDVAVQESWVSIVLEALGLSGFRNSLRKLQILDSS